MPDPTRPTVRSRTGIRLGAVALLAAAASLTGCSGDRPTLAAAPSTLPSQSTAATTTTTTVPLTSLPTSELNVLGFIATPKGPPQVYAEPDASSARIDVPSTTDIGAPTTFAVIGNPATQPGPWYKVMLPVRPNTATGWVQASTVELARTDLRVFVDLGGRRLKVRNSGQDVLDVPIAIGTESNPTPTGPSYVTELIKNVNPGGSYGPYAFGLSIHSDTLTEFAGGDGQVGIHGTNRPQLIGQRVSHGCVRLKNEDIQRLVDLQLPLGAPVFIT